MSEELFVNVMFPDEYSDFVAEFCYKGECFCVLTQEDGPSIFSLEFSTTTHRVPLDAFLQRLQQARDRLYELRKKED